MPEVGFQALARIVVERDECFELLAGAAAHIAAHPVVTAGVAMLVAQSAKDLGRRVLLLGRCCFVGLQDRVDDRLKPIDERGHRPALIGFGFGRGQDLADLASGVMKPPRQFPDAQLVNAMRAANACVLVHRDHPPPPCSWTPGQWTSLQEAAGVGPFSTSILVRGWVRIRRALPNVQEVKDLWRQPAEIHSHGDGFFDDPLKGLLVTQLLLGRRAHERRLRREAGGVGRQVLLLFCVGNLVSGG